MYGTMITLLVPLRCRQRHRSP